MKYKAGKQFAWLSKPTTQHPKGNFHRSGKQMLDEGMMAIATNHHWNQACYESVYCFPGWTGGRISAETAKSAIVDRVYFDFDCKEDPLRAIRDASGVVSCIGHSTNWFSGMKGAGVLIHCEPVDLIPDLKGAVLSRFAIEMQDEFPNIKTMDMAVTGDVNRVHRIIDSIHQGTGLHAIGLYTIELANLNLEEIKFMAQKPRGLIQRPKPSKWVAEKLLLIEEEVIKERIQKLVDEQMLSSTKAYQLGVYLQDPDCKREVWDFVKKLEAELRRIRTKKLENIQVIAGGRTKEETWLLKVVDMFKMVGRAANIQPPGSNASTSSSEQEARVHLVKLANDCGWTLDQMRDMFAGADDYNQKVTEGHIRSIVRT